MDNISDIIASLSDSDIEKLKETAKSVFGDTPVENRDREKQSFPDMGAIDPEMLKKVTEIFSTMNRHDPRCDLIYALKPLLSQNRQQRADEAVKILRIMEVIPGLKKQR